MSFGGRRRRVPKGIPFQETQQDDKTNWRCVLYEEGKVVRLMESEAKIQIIVTDQGNGGAFCSNCSHCLDDGDASKKLPTHCPKCSALFTGQEEPYINRGGSDF